LIEIADLILTYTSTIGLEAALMGKPVMVAGQTHYRAKGFTLDSDTETEYFDKLNEVLKMTDSKHDVDVQSARRYSFLFFRRYMIDFSKLINQEKSSKIHLKLKNLNDLKSKQNSELNAVVGFILETKNIGDHQALIL
jgi:capsule polysaccharide export protein KpsC/LpsZ